MTKAILLAMALTVIPTQPQPEIQETWISEEIQEICYEVEEEYGICAEIIEAMIERESSGQVDAKNGNCVGLMQVNKNVHKKRMEKLGVTDIYEPKSNILVAVDLLLELRETYEDIGLTISAYHGEKVTPDTTKLSKYTTKILNRAADLEKLHDMKGE